MMEKFRNFDKKYIKRVLLNKDADDYLSLRLQEITIDEHYARLYMPAMIMHEKLQVVLITDSVHFLLCDGLGARMSVRAMIS